MQFWNIFYFVSSAKHKLIQRHLNETGLSVEISYKLLECKTNAFFIGEKEYFCQHHGGNEYGCLICFSLLQNGLCLRSQVTFS